MVARPVFQVRATRVSIVTTAIKMQLIFVEMDIGTRFGKLHEPVVGRFPTIQIKRFQVL